jgi:hypothetical protein
MKQLEATALNGVENNVKFETPYSVEIEVTGASAILFHKWDCEVIQGKADARKGSKEKKTDNLESFIYRNEEGYISLPGEYLRMAMVYAAKFKQDPRSPRKSAFDLFKAGIISLTELAPMNGGVMKWDYLDQRRVVIQRSGITRMRPAFLKGWTAEFVLMVNTPEYIDFQFFYEVLQVAGRLIGVGDFRPTYGRFDITKCKIIK